MENICYVISRDQVNLELNIVECRNRVIARQLCNENRRNYVDSIYMTLDDMRQLSNAVGKNLKNTVNTSV
jgi:Flp pilus assembly secretin CpaC